MIRDFYLLVHNDTKKPLFLKLPKKHFIFITDEYYFPIQKEIDYFTLSEKLYVVNNLSNFSWKKISPIELIFRCIFFNTTSPFDFKLYFMDKKIAISVNGKIEDNILLQ